MAYDEFLAERISRILENHKVDFYEKKMFGGLCFMVDGKMCCGVMFNKKHNLELIMARIGEDAYTKAILKAGVKPMDFTGRPMKGYVFVTPDGYDTDADLEFWINLCLAFNPFAKASNSKKRKG